MKHFPLFMKNPKNKIDSFKQNTEDIEGYYFEGKMAKKPPFKILIVTLMFILIFTSAFPAEKYGLTELQGAWWSDPTNPTADFSIEGDQVWLDYDSQYHPCRVEGDVLIFDLGDLGYVRNRIISLEGNKLVLEHIGTNQRRTLTNMKH